VFAYAAAYLLAVIGAVHPGEAFYGFLRALNYLVIYAVVIYFVKKRQGENLILKIIFAAGTGVALIGILAASGYSDYPGAFDGRAINSTLQYANSTAAYLATITIIGLTLFLLAESRWQRFIYTISVFLMVFVVLTTYSKGAWLIFVIGVALLFALIPGLYRKLAVLYIFILTFTAGLISHNQFALFAAAKDSGFSYLYPGLLLTIAGFILLEILYHVKNTRGEKTALVSALAFFILAGAIGQITLGDKIAGKVAADENLTRELSRFTDFSDSSYAARADFYRWAWEIVRDYPVNGTGAGGWNALYHQYQDYLIWTTEVHSHFWQVWVEAGTIGFLAFMSMWIFMLWGGYRILRGEIDTRKKIFTGGVVSTALALGLHALIDFDLSLGAISIILWTLLALISAEAERKQAFAFKLKKGNIVQPVAAVLAAFMLLFCGSTYYIGAVNAVQGSKNLNLVLNTEDEKERNLYYQQAVKYYEKACSLNPLSAEYKTDLAYAYVLRYLALKEADHPLAGQALSQTAEMIDKAGKLKPYDLKIRSSLLNTASLTGDFEIMRKQAGAVIKANPLDINAYEGSIKILAAGMDLYEKNKEQEKASGLAKEIVDVYQMYEAKKRMLNLKRGYWDGPRFNLGGEAVFAVGKAYFLQGEYGQAAKILEPFTQNLILTEFSDPEFRNTKHEDDNWKLASVNDKTALDSYALRAEAKKDLIGWPKVLDLALRLPLYPGGTYVLEVRYRVENYVPNSEGDTSPYLGIWSSISGSAGSKNTSFAFYRYTPENQETSWQVAKQELKIEPGYNTRTLYVGTGSIGRGTVFLIDYVKFYPLLTGDVPDKIAEPYALYAASLYKTGEREKAERIANELKINHPEMHKRYEELIKRNP
jgi:tetratricopeptide (TPR) repeat protein